MCLRRISLSLDNCCHGYVRTAKESCSAYQLIVLPYVTPLIIGDMHLSCNIVAISQFCRLVFHVETEIRKRSPRPVKLGANRCWTDTVWSSISWQYVVLINPYRVDRLWLAHPLPYRENLSSFVKVMKNELSLAKALLPLLSRNIALVDFADP